MVNKELLENVALLKRMHSEGRHGGEVITWKSRERITIAPDTLILQATVKLGLCSEEVLNGSEGDRQAVAAAWEKALCGTGPGYLYDVSHKCSRNARRVEWMEASLFALNRQP